MQYHHTDSPLKSIIFKKGPLFVLPILSFKGNVTFNCLVKQKYLLQPYFVALIKIIGFVY